MTTVYRETKNGFFKFAHNVESTIVRVESTLTSYRWLDIMSIDMDEIRRTLSELKRITVDKNYTDNDFEYVISKYRKNEKFSILINLKPENVLCTFARYNLYNCECESIHHALEIAEYGMKAEMNHILNKYVSSEFVDDLLELIETFN